MELFQSLRNLIYSPKYSVNCGDLHKSYQALEILLIGTTMEMLRLYLHSTEDPPSCSGFLQFEPSPTYRLIKHLILNYALAIVIQKIGDRHNNYAVHSAGRFRFMEFFYGFNHPWYQQIEYNDLKTKTTYPEPVYEMRKKNLSFGLSDENMKSQGGDFILEGKIKRQKMLATKGSDDQQMWRRVSRCLDDIINITNNVNASLNIHDTDGIRKTDLSKEITAWRLHIRESEYLKLYQGDESVYSITGKELSQSMIELPTQLKHCMNTYWQMIEGGEAPKLNPICVIKYMDDLIYFENEDDL